MGRLPTTSEERTTFWLGVLFMACGFAASFIFEFPFWGTLIALLATFLGGVFVGTAAEAYSARKEAGKFSDAARRAQSAKHRWF